MILFLPLSFTLEWLSFSLDHLPSNATISPFIIYPRKILFLPPSFTLEWFSFSLYDLT